jgi:hypothetical protein
MSVIWPRHRQGTSPGSRFAYRRNSGLDAKAQTPRFVMACLQSHEPSSVAGGAPIWRSHTTRGHRPNRSRSLWRLFPLSTTRAALARTVGSAQRGNARLEPATRPQHSICYRSLSKAATAEPPPLQASSSSKGGAPAVAPFDGWRSSSRTIASIAVTVPRRLALGRHLDAGTSVASRRRMPR